MESEEIREKGNIIAYEKQTTIQDDSTLSQEMVEKIKNELEIQRLALNDTCRMIQHTQDGVDQLLYRTEATRKLIIGINDRYSHYEKYQSINTMLKKLKYTLKTTTKKVEEIQEELIISNREEAAAVHPTSSKKRNFQEIPL